MQLLKYKYLMLFFVKRDCKQNIFFSYGLLVGQCTSRGNLN